MALLQLILKHKYLKIPLKVKRKIFNANDDDNGQKQTWKKEIKSFLRKASPHLHSKNNSIYEDMMIEYKEDAMGNNNGCHVDVGNKKFERNGTHGQFVPVSEVRMIKFIFISYMTYSTTSIMVHFYFTSIISYLFLTKIVQTCCFANF